MLGHSVVLLSGPRLKLWTGLLRPYRPAERFRMPTTVRSLFSFGSWQMVPILGELDHAQRRAHLRCRHLMQRRTTRLFLLTTLSRPSFVCPRAEPDGAGADGLEEGAGPEASLRLTSTSACGAAGGVLWTQSVLEGTEYSFILTGKVGLHSSVPLTTASQIVWNASRWRSYCDLQVCACRRCCGRGRCVPTISSTRSYPLHRWAPPSLSARRSRYASSQDAGHSPGCRRSVRS